MRLCGSIVLLVSLLSASAMAMPSVINYQGTLKKGDGTMSPVGTHTIQFRIFDQANGGNELYKQTKVAYVDTNGVFSVTLGSADDNAKSIASVFSGSGVGTRFLELTVTADPLGPVGVPSPILPRQEMANAPFALRAGYAENVDNTMGNLQVGGDLRLMSNVLSMAGSFSISGGSGSKMDFTNSGDVVVTPYRGFSVTNATFVRAALSGGQDSFKLETNAVSMMVDGVETRFSAAGTTNRISGEDVGLQVLGTALPTAAGQSELMVKDSSVAMIARDASTAARASVTATVGGTNILSSSVLSVSASGGATLSAGTLGVTASAATFSASSLGMTVPTMDLSGVGSIKMGSEPLMFIKPVRMPVNTYDSWKDTGVSTNNYVACVVGQYFPSVDIYEDGHAPWILRTAVSNGNWWVQWRYHLHGAIGGDAWVDVLFMRRALCTIEAPLY